MGVLKAGDWAIAGLADRGVAAAVAGLGTAGTGVSGLVPSFGVTGRESDRGGGSRREETEFLRGDIRSMLRGGIAIGSRRMAGLISGAGTRSLSPCDGRNGSIGGRFRSGGFSSSCDAGGGRGGSGATRLDVLAGPFRDPGRKLLPPSLRAVVEAANESWLLLLAARRRREGCSWDGRPNDSTLCTGDALPPF